MDFIQVVDIMKLCRCNVLPGRVSSVVIIIDVCEGSGGIVTVDTSRECKKINQLKMVILS